MGWGREGELGALAHAYLFNVGALPANDELHSLLRHSHLYLDVVLPNERQPLFCTDHSSSDRT